ncbi:MAG: HAD family hydrolase [Deltaproteobacteria bacterium]|nr:HAD family hydrolase [Deltaproteobacteria bacterium]
MRRRTDSTPSIVGRTLTAVLFDLDNTLIDRDTALGRFLAKRLPPPLVEKALALGTLPRDSTHNRRRLYHDLCAEFPSEFDPSHFSESDLLDGIVAEIQPDPRVRATLTDLARTYRLGLVTNGGSMTQRRKLAAAELAGFFEVITISAEAGCEKPEPRIFLETLAALGVHADAALFVGDDPVRDIDGARAAGLRACWVARTALTHPTADLQIASVTELRSLLALPTNADNYGRARSTCQPSSNPTTST